MRYWPLALTGSVLVGLSDGAIGSKRSILPSGVVKFCALPYGSMWLAPTSFALPPSPSARYMYPSGPNVIVPPLWLPAFLPNEMISRRDAGSTWFGLLDDIFHS